MQWNSICKTLNMICKSLLRTFMKLLDKIFKILSEIFLNCQWKKSQKITRKIEKKNILVSFFFGLESFLVIGVVHSHQGYDIDVMCFVPHSHVSCCLYYICNRLQRDCPVKRACRTVKVKNKTTSFPQQNSKINGYFYVGVNILGTS